MIKNKKLFGDDIATWYYFLNSKIMGMESLIQDYDFTISTLAGSFFYVTTGAHGIHVFVGLIFIMYFIYKAHIGAGILIMHKVSNITGYIGTSLI